MTWRKPCILLALVATVSVPGTTVAQKPRIQRTTLPHPLPQVDTGDDEKALRQEAIAYAEAVNKGDLKAILEQWASHGEYRNNLGVTLEGRAALQETYKKWLAENPKATIKVGVDRIRLLSKEAAWVEGTIHLERADGTSSRSRFRTLRIKEGGAWRISESMETIQTGSQLADLDWLKGSWSGKAGDDEATFFVEPVLDGAFLKVDFTRKNKGKMLQQGFHLIGSDPRGQGLVSSVFEASQAMGQGRWVHDGHHWEVEMSGMDATGLDASAIQVITQLSKTSLTWQAIERVVGGVRLSDTVPLKLTRTK